MKTRLFTTSKLLVILFLAIGVILPLGTLLLHINMKDFSDLLQSPQFWPMIMHSLITTSISTLLAIILAFSLSYCIHRSNMKHKAIFAMLLTLPMLIPSISHGMGLVLLFGDNGIITNLFHINISLYGYTGIIMGSILYAFPVAFLMLSDAFSYEDYTSYEVAKVMGLSFKAQLFNITLRNMKPILISVIFATFTLIFTDYGVPLVVGGKVMTLPLYMYREVIGLLDFSKGAIIGSFLLLPAFIAFVIDLKNKNQTSLTTLTKPFQIAENKKRDTLSKIFCWIVVIFISLPLIAFILLSFIKQYPIDFSFSLSNIKEALHLGMRVYLKNSLAIAFVSSLIGTCIIYLVAFITTRSKRNFSTNLLHFISMLSMAIPGLVLGLCYVLFFKTSLIYGTIYMLILVNIVHFFASPYLLAYQSLRKFHRNFEDLSTVMGISKWKMLKDVYIPSTKATLIEMFSYIFVNCMVTISAISFLANFKTMPLALLIPQFDSQSLIEATAFISVVIFFVNLFMKIVVYFVKNKLLQKEEQA